MAARTLLAACAAMLFSIGAAAADRPADEAADRITEALTEAPHDRVSDAGESRDLGRHPFMVANDGARTFIVIGCQDGCTLIRLRLRVSGLPDLLSQSPRRERNKLIVEVPAQYTRALSNFELDISASCGGLETCAHRWAVLRAGAAPPLNARGLPPPPTDAEWNAARAPGGAALVWLTRPSAEDMRFFYPVTSLRAGRQGSARLHCLAGEGGVLRCRDAEEAPGGAGFGEAARRLSSVLRVRADDADGQPIANRQIVLPVRFQPPQ